MSNTIIFTQEQLDAAIEKWRIENGMLPPVLCLLGDPKQCPAWKALQPASKCPNCQKSKTKTI